MAAQASKAAASLAVSSLFSVAGKVVCVSGGGRGIGEMISRAFVSNGAKVYISSRNTSACDATAAALSAIGPGVCISLPEDLSTEKGCLALAARFGALESRLDVLVNNSGIAWGHEFETFPEAQFDRVMALNVKTPFLLTRAMKKYLDSAAKPGSPSRIINIGSITGIVPQPVPTYSYDISKAAIHHLTRKLSAEFAPDITVNAIAPGFVPSRMSKGLLTYAAESDIASAIPMGRWGEAGDMGGAALYLASAAGRWVTGQILVVDGGQTAKPLNLMPSEDEEPAPAPARL